MGIAIKKADVEIGVGEDDGASGVDAAETRKVRKVANTALPLPVPMDDGTICIVDIPRMTAATFAFFTKQLEAYKSAIIVPPAADPSDADNE